MAKSILRYFEQAGEVNEFGDLVGDALINGTFGTPSKHTIALTGTDGGKIVFKGDFKVKTVSSPAAPSPASPPLSTARRC